MTSENLKQIFYGKCEQISQQLFGQTFVWFRCQMTLGSFSFNYITEAYF